MPATVTIPLPYRDQPYPTVSDRSETFSYGTGAEFKSKEFQNELVSLNSFFQFFLVKNLKSSDFWNITSIMTRNSLRKLKKFVLKSLTNLKKGINAKLSPKKAIPSLSSHSYNRKSCSKFSKTKICCLSLFI